METDHALPCLSAFQEHHHDLLRFFTHKLGCRDLAADCTQETYIHLVRMGQTITVQNPPSVSLPRSSQFVYRLFTKGEDSQERTEY